MGPPTAATPPRCFVLYDRHVEKNGGSTMRVLMKRLEEHGECAYWGYYQSPQAWARVMEALRQGNVSGAPPRLCGASVVRTPCFCTPTPTAPFGTVHRRCARAHTASVAVEAHTGGEASQRLSELGELLRTLRQTWSDCRVFRSLRVREPLSHYVSFFTWGVARWVATSRATMDLQESRHFIRWANACVPARQTHDLTREPRRRGVCAQNAKPAGLHTAEAARS